jgi:hypothetical protein
VARDPHTGGQASAQDPQAGVQAAPGGGEQARAEEVLVR